MGHTPTPICRELGRIEDALVSNDSLGFAATVKQASETITALIAALERWDDMITNCVGVPQNPDSLPMMLRHEIRAALTAAQGASADTGER